MVTSNLAYLESELMDVVRLFPGAEELSIIHNVLPGEKVYRNEFLINGVRFSSEEPAVEGEEHKSLQKRFAKLALYEILSEHFQKSLPWGSVTGIRPTRLAYSQLQKGRDFRPMFEKLRVSPENTELIAKVIAGQEGILEQKEGNVDLYVSLPFCPSKCDYCSFITAPIDKTRQYMTAYLEALSRELKAAAPLIHNLRSVYIGGGTPFALNTEELEQVFQMVAPLRTNGCEYTVEAGRPDVFTQEKLDLCVKYGVTRICINAQSFSDKTLSAIGRRHTQAQLYEAFEITKPYPFIVNCDLIAGLTGESLEEFCDSVNRAIALSPENITVHTLCLKKGARLKEEHLQVEQGTVVPLADDALSAMIAYSREALSAAGYEPYYLYRQKYMAGSHENVGWTKKGYASVYNIDVMEEACDNLAAGANAISKRVFIGEGRIERIGSPKDIPTYIAKVDKIIEDKKKLFS